MPEHAMPAPKAPKSGPPARPKIKSAGPVGFGCDNNNADSNKRPKIPNPKHDGDMNRL